MATELPTLGELESLVLRLVWREQPCSERQIPDMAFVANRPIGSRFPTMACVVPAVNVRRTRQLGFSANLIESDWIAEVAWFG